MKDIDWVEGLLHVDGKNDNRTIPFGRKTKQALKRYIDQERKAISPRIDAVFLTIHGEKMRSRFC